MTPKHFAALATMAALSLIAAIAVYSARAPWTTSTTEAGKLFPGLEADAGKIARIAISQGESAITLEKSGDQWLVKSQDGYPASAEKIRALLIALAEARLLEPKTRIAERYSILEVDDPAGKHTSARLIKLEDASGNTLAEIIAGKRRPGHVGSTPGSGQGTGGTYVRRPGDDQSWLASTTISGSPSLKDWANPRVFETQTEKIKTLTVAVQGETPYDLKRNDDGSHALAVMPEGKKLKYVNMVDNIIEAASFLDFERVRKATGATGGEAGTVSFETDDGLKIALKVRRDKDAVWITVDPSGEGNAKTAADEIKARTAGWEFEVIPSKADTMLKKQADLLEDVEPETPPQESALPTPAPAVPPAVPTP